MCGQTVNNLHAVCGVEEGTAIRNAQKRTITPHPFAAIAS
jgi:hypothetical protein